MGKKTFILMLVLVVATGTFVILITNYQPAAMESAHLESLPLEFDGWAGVQETIPGYVIDQLNPAGIFAANYSNRDGTRINLLVDYFSGNDPGGPHSPRNCMPGAGWVIEDSFDRPLNFDGRTIPAVRFVLRLGESRRVMDFWYVTKHGETANDYAFKFYVMLSSLSLQPTDIAFIRFFAPADSISLAALDRFEEASLPLIYERLPF